MRGISEEMLNKCYDSALRMDDKIAIPGLEIAMVMCTELNTWQPIESAPKDRHVLLHISVGPIDCRNFVGNAHDSWPWKPTHWQELPHSPELPEPPK